MRNDVEEKVIQILAGYADIPADNIGLDSKLQQDLKLNSLDVVNLVVEFEETFGVEIDEPDIRRFQKVRDLTDYLSEHTEDDEV